MGASTRGSGLEISAMAVGGRRVVLATSPTMESSKMTNMKAKASWPGPMAPGTQASSRTTSSMEKVGNGMAKAIDTKENTRMVTLMAEGSISREMVLQSR